MFNDYNYMELKLEAKEIQLIRQGLGRLPFDDVAALIIKIEQQLKAQLETKEVKDGNY